MKVIFPIMPNNMEMIAQYLTTITSLYLIPDILEAYALLQNILLLSLWQIKFVWNDQDTFRIVVELDGTNYVIQAVDEADKNHDP